MGLLKNLVARGKEVIVLSDLSQVSNIELLNKLLYRPNMHCFIIESPLDNATQIPFSIFGKVNGQTKFTNSFSKKEPEVIKGRYKKINVKDRYLEKFVREML